MKGTIRIIALALTGAFLISGCQADRATAPAAHHVVTHSYLTVAPTGVTTGLSICYPKFAGVYATWDVVAGSTVTWVTVGAFDHTTGAALYTDAGASGRLAAYTQGAIGTLVPYGTFDLKLFNWEPDAANPGHLKASDPFVVPLTIAKKDCPKGKP